MFWRLWSLLWGTSDPARPNLTQSHSQSLFNLNLFDNSSSAAQVASFIPEFHPPSYFYDQQPSYYHGGQGTERAASEGQGSPRTLSTPIGTTRSPKVSTPTSQSYLSSSSSTSEFRQDFQRSASPSPYSLAPPNDGGREQSETDVTDSEFQSLDPAADQPVQPTKDTQTDSNTQTETATTTPPELAIDFQTFLSTPDHDQGEQAIQGKESSHEPTEELIEELRLLYLADRDQQSSAAPSRIDIPEPIPFDPDPSEVNQQGDDSIVDLEITVPLEPNDESTKQVNDHVLVNEECLNDLIVSKEEAQQAGAHDEKDNCELTDVDETFASDHESDINVPLFEQTPEFVYTKSSESSETTDNPPPEIPTIVLHEVCDEASTCSTETWPDPPPEKDEELVTGMDWVDESESVLAQKAEDENSEEPVQTSMPENEGDRVEADLNAVVVEREASSDSDDDATESGSGSTSSSSKSKGTASSSPCSSELETPKSAVTEDESDTSSSALVGAVGYDEQQASARGLIGDDPVLDPRKVCHCGCLQAHPLRLTVSNIHKLSSIWEEILAMYWIEYY